MGARRVAGGGQKRKPWPDRGARGVVVDCHIPDPDPQSPIATRALLLSLHAKGFSNARCAPLLFSSHRAPPLMLSSSHSAQLMFSC